MSCPFVFSELNKARLSEQKKVLSFWNNTKHVFLQNMPKKKHRQNFKFSVICQNLSKDFEKFPTDKLRISCKIDESPKLRL